VLISLLKKLDKAGQRAAYLSQNQDVHYIVNTSSPPVDMLRRTNPVHTPPHYFPMIYLILLYHLHLVLVSGLFPSGLRAKMFNAVIFCTMLHTPTISFSLIWTLQECLTKTTNHEAIPMQCTPAFCYSSSLILKYFLQHNVLKILKPFFALHVRHQISRQFATTKLYRPTCM
jgi:hypothetical protein